MLKPDILIILANEGVTLKNNVTKCVFHDEKTASLRIYPKNNSYYCYGCGVGGDSIDFIMRLKSLSYTEAVRYVGMKPRQVTKRDIKKRDLISKFNDWLRRYHAESCQQYRTIQNHKRLARNIDDINPSAYHAEPGIIHRLDILDGDDRAAKLALYREAGDVR